MPLRVLPVPLARPQLTVDEHPAQRWHKREHGEIEGPAARYGMSDVAPRSYDVATTVLTFEDGSVTFRNQHALDARSRLLYEENLAFSTLPVALERLQRVEETLPEVAYLSNTWSTNFYHWLCLTLPLLRHYTSAGLSPERFYVGNRLTGWQTRSLQLAGIEADRIVTGPCRAQVAHVAVSTRQGGAVSPEQVEWVRSALVKNEPLPGSRRFFVGRGQTTTRQMLGEEEVANALVDELGFEYIVTSDMTLDEEIELFATAEAIVGPFGAAFTNVLFAPLGTKVLELQAFDADFPASTAFLELSRVLGHSHGVLRGESTPPKGRAIATNVKVSPEVVLRAVETMLGLD
jgi:hypothetical protein